MTPEEFLAAVMAEYTSARLKFPAFHSTHEAYAVMLEELEEYWELCKKNSYRGYEYREELIQLAAMCYSALKELHPA